MTPIDQEIAQHYTHGSLEAAILVGLEKLRSMSELSLVDHLAGVDEFHIGGRPVTAALAEQLQLSHGLSVLDVGCGLGGTARFLATAYGCMVSGVDITPEYVEVGGKLNRKLGLDGQIELRCASALDMPFEDASFDRVTMLHVGMNISDKDALFSEVSRVTKLGGYALVYDIMCTNAETLAYPVAWAQNEAMSFVAAPECYRRALEANRFELLTETSMRDVAVRFFETIRARLAEAGPPPLGLHILMGNDAPQKVANMLANVQKGSIAPVLILARRR